MNGCAGSKIHSVKTKVNEGYIGISLHRKKVYLAFKKMLVIMEVRMMLLELQEMVIILIESESTPNSG